MTVALAFVFLAGAAQLAAFAGIARLHRQWDDVPWLLTWHAVALLAYAIGCGATWAATGRGAPAARAAWLLVLAFAAASRLSLLVAPPWLSEDAYRHVWDGRLQAQGLNPYGYAPDDPSLAALRTSNWERITFPGLRPPYPPLAEAAFAALWQLAGDRPLAFKAAAAALDWLVVVVLALLLRQLHLPAAWTIVYAWHPLPVVEFAGSGHFDPLMLLPLVLSIERLAAGRPLQSGALLGIATLGKLVPLWLAPVLMRVWSTVHGSRAAGQELAWEGNQARAVLRRAAAPAAVALAVVALGVLPYAGGGDIFRALVDEARITDFNGGIFLLVRGLLLALGLSRADAGLIAKSTLALSLAWLWVKSWCWTLVPAAGNRRLSDVNWRAARQERLVAPAARPRSGFWPHDSVAAGPAAAVEALSRGVRLLGVALLLSPVVHPWYLTWPLALACPLLAAGGLRVGVPWLVWASLAPLAYLWFYQPNWGSAGAFVQFGCTAGLLLAPGAAQIIRRSPRQDSDLRARRWGDQSPPL